MTIKKASALVDIRFTDGTTTTTRVGPARFLGGLMEAVWEHIENETDAAALATTGDRSPVEITIWFANFHTEEAE